MSDTGTDTTTDTDTDTTTDTTTDTSASAGLAVITGASSGIGAELAAQFADAGHDLLVVAESVDFEGAAANDLRGRGVTVTTVIADLQRPDEVDRVVAAVRATGRPVTALALNAGIGSGGAFLETDLADQLAVIDLNVRSTVQLAHGVIGDMAAAGAGRVLVTSSIASTVPGPYQAIYNASKSFLQSFTEALQVELADTGVTVTSLMPGPTDTNFFHRAGNEDDTLMGRGPKDDPADVARQGFEAMAAGRRRVVAASLATKAQELIGKATPDRVKAVLHSVIAKPRERLRG